MNTKFSPRFSVIRSLMRWSLLLGLLGSAATATAANVVIWDTGIRQATGGDLPDRSKWKVVPGELFSLEAEPQKAASDPGYYGREYQFQGDPVVETPTLTALFLTAQGRVAIFARHGNSGTQTTRSADHPLIVLAPVLAASQSTRMAGCGVVRNAGDEAALRVTFAAADTTTRSAVFAFDRTGTIELQPAAGMKTVVLQCAVEYGIAPTFVGDDLVYGVKYEAESPSLTVPAEKLFVGLLAGETSELVMTWPSSEQRVRLARAAGSTDRRSFESIEFDFAGESLYLTPLHAPGIWHKELLLPTYLEKDVPVAWTRPFPARWKTQLTEANVKTTFAFREAKGQVWRGVPGSYTYPVWFDGEQAQFHLSKKVPPKGEAVIYCLEAQDTPLKVSLPADILKATLGRQASAPILDPAGRNLRTHHRRGGDGVHRACTCGCTDAIQLVFAAGDEVAQRSFVAEALGDMNYFVRCHVERIDEYQVFAREMIKFLHERGRSSPELQPYLTGLADIVQQIPDEYEVQKENMKSPAHAELLTRQTLALTEKTQSNNLQNYLELLKAWRAMGGSQDYVIAHCHMVTRKLYQAAGYGCAELPAAVPIAQEILARCRQILRNPDGYEIWANY